MHRGEPTLPAYAAGQQKSDLGKREYDANWGADYKVKGAEYYMDVPFDPQIFVRARILALTEYVYRLQPR
jgi:hypothetical protein